MTAPVDLSAMYARFEGAGALDLETLELEAKQRRLSHFAAVTERVALPALLGAAALMGTMCLIAQVAIRLQLPGSLP